MPKHALVFVHGMGEHDATFHSSALGVLSAAFKEYSAYQGMGELTDWVEPVPVVYSDLFTKLRARWKQDAAAIKGVLLKQIDADDAGQRADVEKNIDKVENLIGAGTDSFVWTHAMDVVLYRFFSTVRMAVNVSVAEQMLKVAGVKYDGWSIVAHSLGTAVTHNALNALYSGPIGKSKASLDPITTRPRLLAMVANVSRVLQLPTVKVFSSKVAPGSVLAGRVCDTYLNVRHRYDPFVIPQPFKPDSTWPDVETHFSRQYQAPEPAHLLVKSYREVHDLDHYLKNPRVHVPIFESLFGETVDDAETEAACKKFDGSILAANTNAIRNALDASRPAESDDWSAFLGILKNLGALGSVP